MDKILYAHTGSENHGCEAIVRSSINIIGGNFFLYSGNKDADKNYKIDEICMVMNQGSHLKRYGYRHAFFKIMEKFDCFKSYNEFTYSFLLKNICKDKLYISIGGDMYCYKNVEKSMGFINRYINDHGGKTILWGCSIEPGLLKNTAVVDDLKRYLLITPRESITYQALLNAGISRNVKLYPDPAFTLQTKNVKLPVAFETGDIVGINISPLIVSREKTKGITMKNYTAILKYIIENTKLKIALIPHVVSDYNDDRNPLIELYNCFKETNRVLFIDDADCTELKAYIAKCCMFIGARTHATIAAYSACVPTLVIGYSVKAKGIAKDIFGTYENYVIPVQTLENKDELINAFKWIEKNQDKIKEHLQSFMPGYIAKAYEAGKEVEKLINA